MRRIDASRQMTRHDRADVHLCGPLLLALFAACAPPPGAPPADVSATSTLQSLEEHLLAVPVLHLRYRANAEGAFDAQLAGELRLEGTEHGQLTATGTFDGAPVDLHLEIGNGLMRGGSSEQRFDQRAPEHLRPALVLGLTRMGILHNLARLSSGRPPDHAEGGVEEWVQPRDAAWSDAAPEGVNAARGIQFGVEVAGQRAADATLWLDSNGLPVRRTQEVSFPGGQMIVVEEYEVVSLEPPQRSSR